MQKPQVIPDNKEAILDLLLQSQHSNSSETNKLLEMILQNYLK